MKRRKLRVEKWASMVCVGQGRVKRIRRLESRSRPRTWARRVR